MSTLIPPLSKKQIRKEFEKKKENLSVNESSNVLIKFRSLETGEIKCNPIRVPTKLTELQLEELLNQLLGQKDDPISYSISLLENEKKDEMKLVSIKGSLNESIIKPNIKTIEDTLVLVFIPKAIFRVKPVIRSSSAISGHSSTILCCEFAPNTSTRLCTGSGDSTARIWDTNTFTPLHELIGHTNWVLCVSYSPCGLLIATGSMDSTIILWDSESGKQLSNPLIGHSKWITSLAWEPLHLVKNRNKPNLASGSKDGVIHIWDVETKKSIMSLSGHKSSITCVKWSGLNLIYSSSHDKTIKCWNLNEKGKLLKTLNSHSHWVNHLSLSNDYVLRKGPFDHTSNNKSTLTNFKNLQEKALISYEKASKLNKVLTERLVSASDDFTLYLWDPVNSSTPISRLLGHQKLVNCVSFSPNGCYIASGSFDNTIRIWDGFKGNFISKLIGHVGPVFQLAWSSDSRFLVSCSKDTTLKLWDISTMKLKVNLSGHKDEIYAVDWSNDGKFVISGGKDKQLRIWSQ